MPTFVSFVLALATFLAAGEAMRRRRGERLALLTGSVPSRRRSPRLLQPPPWLVPVAAAVTGAVLGWRTIGPVGALVGSAAGAAPRAVRRAVERRRGERAEAQLADTAETVALGIRSGLSIPQALGFAAEEAERPMREHLERIDRDRGLGTPLERALRDFGRSLGTEDAALFVLILTTHARSGGNLGAALDEVATALRDRVRARRDLRALTAQGRMSGAILGALPIGFASVLALTSRHELAPVYRSGPGQAMVVGGLVLEALAWVWVRSMLRIDP